MNRTTENLLRRNLHGIFGERDETRRQRAISEVMAADVVFADPEGHHVGHDAVNAIVTALLAKFPDFAFTELTPPQAVSGAGRIQWRFGPPGGSPKVTGMDVIVVRDGRIATLYTFLDPPGTSS